MRSPLDNTTCRARSTGRPPSAPHHASSSASARGCLCQRDPTCAHEGGCPRSRPLARTERCALCRHWRRAAPKRAAPLCQRGDDMHQIHTAFSLATRPCIGVCCTSTDFACSQSLHRAMVPWGARVPGHTCSCVTSTTRTPVRTSTPDCSKDASACRCRRSSNMVRMLCALCCRTWSGCSAAAHARCQTRHDVNRTGRGTYMLVHHCKVRDPI